MHDNTSVMPAPATPPGSSAPDQPMVLRPGSSLSDQVFRAAARVAGAVVLTITRGIGLFLGVRAIPVFKTLGWSFFTTKEWNPETGQIGIAAVLVGTLELAAVAVVVAFPLALGLALFISEYASPDFDGALSPLST